MKRCSVGALALIYLLVVGVTSCAPASPSSNACAEYTTPAGFDALHPTASLKNDVIPIFVQSCSFSSCHGSSGSSQGSLFLGTMTQTGATAEIRANLEVASVENPSMPYVTAGDPSKSFLMRKIDGDQCTLEAQCTKPDGCLASMPQNMDLLPLASRDLIRRWIAQGALDN